MARHQAVACRVAYVIAGDDAEDAVQEAFIRMRLAWRRLRDPDRAGAYLRTTVLNLARGRMRRRLVALRRRPAGGPDASAAEDVAVTRDEHRLVVLALRDLPVRQKECLVLRYYLVLSEAEIAETLGISAGSVKTHVHRGMAALTQALEELA